VKTYAVEQEELKHSFLRSVKEAEDSDGAYISPHFLFYILVLAEHNFHFDDNPRRISDYNDIRITPSPYGLVLEKKLIFLNLFFSAFLFTWSLVIVLMISSHGPGL